MEHVWVRSLSKDTQQTHLNEHGQRNGGRGRNGEIFASTLSCIEHILTTVRVYCRCFIYYGNTTGFSNEIKYPEINFL